MNKWNIRFVFADGATYSYIYDPEKYGDEDNMMAGHWREPFPNEKGNSQAFGLVESFVQSDIGGPLCAEHEEVTEVVASKVGDELDRLREENATLRYQVRQLTRKQTNPDMMSVDFKAHEATFKMLNRISHLNPWAEELWKDLQKARDAYQSLDNFHNWFKTAVLEALEGAPELTEAEEADAETNNNGYTARIYKVVAEHKRHKAGLESAWSLLNDWYFGRRGDSLDAETSAWVDAWETEVGNGK